MAAARAAGRPGVWSGDWGQPVGVVGVQSARQCHQGRWVRVAGGGSMGARSWERGDHSRPSEAQPPMRRMLGVGKEGVKIEIPRSNFQLGLEYRSG